MKGFFKSILFYIISLCFFALYFKIVNYVFNKWMPLNTTFDLISILILFFVALPLSFVSAGLFIKLVKKI